MQRNNSYPRISQALAYLIIIKNNRFPYALPTPSSFFFLHSSAKHAVWVDII